MLNALTPETLVPLRFEENQVLILDQRLLPHRVVWMPIHVYQDMVESISTMMIRGAPAIGVAGAFGTALGVKTIADHPDFDRQLAKIIFQIVAARPTAINLAWGCEKVRTAVQNAKTAQDRNKKAFEAAEVIRKDDVQRCRTLSQHGSELLADGDQVLTICNAGALATAGYGTAVGVIRYAASAGKKLHVWVSETRPRLQGARLTVLELQTLAIPHTLITDSMAGHLMAAGKVSKVVVGADRIAANGDTANKIGTYTLAVLAHAHRIPFYVAAPGSTVDIRCPDGPSIPLEYRDPSEVLNIHDRCITMPQTQALNVAFDVTPAALITGIITEKGIRTPPFSFGEG